MPSVHDDECAAGVGSGRVDGAGDVPDGPRSPSAHDRESRAVDGRGRVTGAGRVLGPRMPPVQGAGVTTDAGVDTDTGVDVAREGGSVGESQVWSLQTMKPQESRTALACPWCSRPSAPRT
jgi:hypothetical protein